MINVNKDLRAELDQLAEASAYSISPLSIRMLKAVLLGRCRVLTEHVTEYKDILELGLKAVVCGAFVAVALQKHICNDDTTRFTKQDTSPVTLADLCVQVVMIEVMRIFYETHSVKVIAEENLDHFNETQLQEVADILNKVIPLRLLHGIAVQPYWGSVETQWTTDLILERFHQAARKYHDGVESNTAAQQEFYVVIDPIDGTKGFLREAQFAIALGVVHGATHQCVVSVIACPNLSLVRTLTAESINVMNNKDAALYYAVATEGARCVDLFSLLEPKALKLGDQPSKSVLFVSSAERKHNENDCIHQCCDHLNLHCPPDVVRLDSMAKYGLVAQGKAHVFLRCPGPHYREYVWDILPGLLLVEEAGGLVSHGDGSCITYQSGSTKLNNTSGIVVTGHGGQCFHNQVVESLGKKKEKKM